MNPDTLLILARKAVNKNLITLNSIHKLELPVCLKRELFHEYLSDRLLCSEAINMSPSILDRCQETLICTPYTNIGCDMFLQMMNWPLLMPEFCFEDNVVSYRYFITFGSSIRYCDICIQERSDKIVYEYQEYDRVTSQEVIEEVVQQSDSWCNNCYTTALFYFIDRSDFGTIRSRVKLLNVIIPESD